MTNHFSHGAHFPDSTQSAELLLPHLFDVAGRFESAIDVGGGTGAWSAALKRLGVSRVLCVDDPRLRGEDLLIEVAEFIPCDMSREFPAPITCDLAMCLEVAEHLPEERSTDLVEFLTASADVILFSAAIPGQPSRYHINEQPADFWLTRFQERGFNRFDCMRPRILYDERVPYWYRQNLYVFATESVAGARKLKSLPFAEIPRDFELVHSHVLQQYRKVKRPKMRDVAAVVGRSLRARLMGD